MQEAYIVLMLRGSAAIVRRLVQTDGFNFSVRDIAEDFRLEMADNGEEEQELDDEQALLEMLVSVAFDPKRQRELEEASHPGARHPPARPLVPSLSTSSYASSIVPV